MRAQQALNRYIAATNSHDFNEVKQVLDEHAVYWFTDQICTTHDQIKNYFEAAWALIKDEVYQAREVKWISHDQASATCLYTYYYEGYLDGEFISGSGRATNVFVKNTNNEWKLIHEHLSSGKG
ncbi:SnoaL-like domain-containing protein [Amphibacillus marinus]|uniref:SnoaL-like domain-containing protein n=1 Tax=Amphibacillus marinus TaxID=872970 RepID=A0A1H8LSL1_9BACI|nr:nuclear transport factor 2 family protein [Amphibacillus marinus]SEO08132.1 SnoaL-like domain-containing protein [Amphibacillus marinus]